MEFIPGMSYETHAYANIFPYASSEDFERLASDIGKNGLLERIVLYGGKILDGRNRYRAMINAYVEIKSEHFINFDGTDEEALAFVISKNLARRQLSGSQRDAVAAEIANLKLGDNQHSGCLKLDTQKTSLSSAAKQMKRSRANVAKAKDVKAKAPEVFKALKEGKINTNAAAAIAKLPEHDRRQVLADERPDRAVKKVARRNKERALAAKQCALPVAKFGVIYADPPWSFEPYSENGMDRAADNHYPTQATDDICALDVPSIAAEDCVLFLWATAPMLPDALRVMAAWGFAYVSRCVWAKDRLGTGYWFRDKAKTPPSERAATFQRPPWAINGRR